MPVDVCRAHWPDGLRLAVRSRAFRAAEESRTTDSASPANLFTRRVFGEVSLVSNLQTCLSKPQSGKLAKANRAQSPEHSHRPGQSRR
jgi:hypothetical protein